LPEGSVLMIDSISARELGAWMSTAMPAAFAALTSHWVFARRNCTSRLVLTIASREIPGMAARNSSIAFSEDSA
jgi:hypothetical protein